MQYSLLWDVDSQMRCMEMSQWGSSSWYGDDPQDLHLRKQYFMENGDVDHVIPSTTNNVCTQHTGMRRIQDAIEPPLCCLFL